MGNAWERFKDPVTMPYEGEKPTFDTHYGFSEGRKTRVMIATEEEMRNALIDKEFRDYCAHKLIDILKCKKKEFPFLYRCAPQKHSYLMCEFEDFQLRMKEFEREKRLRKREQRLLAQAVY